ncbi:MAG: exodeoxyribonuclease VII large subunit [Saprospiraceae bacterium]|nr:exodeoxyribonuclease VII large subunit [Candidatus Vicinibacter affinis]
MDETITLKRLNEFIQRVIGLNFEEAIWIRGEVLQAKENRGHIYIELSEKGDKEEIVAQASAVIWKNQTTLINKKFTFNLLSILKEGNQVRVKVLVDFHPRYGLKLIIQDLDSAYTLGQIAQKRLQVISKLKDEHLWQLNKNLMLPKVIQRIALISSKTAAGYLDFTDHLKTNPFKYAFNISHFQTSMQGEKTEEEINNAFHEINKCGPNTFDVVTIIRGGGAKLDLIDFDNFQISKNICECKFPVLTGIGHQTDESIADLNAYYSFKTPTAVAEYILNHNSLFETQLIETFNGIKNWGIRKISIEKLRQENIKAKIYNTFQQKAWQNITNLNDIFSRIKKIGNEKLQGELFNLKNIESILQINDPLAILAKGYTITLQDNRWIKKSYELDQKKEITIKFIDGQIVSKTQQDG